MDIAAFGNNPKSSMRLSEKEFFLPKTPSRDNRLLTDSSDFLTPKRNAKLIVISPTTKLYKRN